MKKILVWDLPVRLGHWLMVGGFALAWATGDSEKWRLVHVFAGSTVMAVAAYRLLWGVVGSRTARFAEFVRGPGQAVAYLKSLLQARPPHYAGHNPAAGLAIVLLLGLALASGASGWLTYQEIGGEWLEEIHEFLTGTMLGVVGVHLLGRAGRQPGPPREPRPGDDHRPQAGRAGGGDPRTALSCRADAACLDRRRGLVAGALGQSRSARYGDSINMPT
jgi:cytochrome b